MQKKKWKQFEELRNVCYSNMIKGKNDTSCWKQTFEVLINIVNEARMKNVQFALELVDLEEMTNYQYDISGWLEDCLDELEMHENYDVVLYICDTLLTTFHWPQYTASDIKFRKASALSFLGQKEVSFDFCKEWMQKEPQNIMAATAFIYASIAIGNFDDAEKLIKEFIPDGTQCTEENDIMFVAASVFYQITEKQKELQTIIQALEHYEKLLSEDFEMGYDDCYDYFEEAMPFKQDDDISKYLQDDYGVFLKECERIRKTNDELLLLFGESLEKAGISIKTINKHLSNVSFYINDYLIREEALSMEAGVEMIDDFLGNFYIRKCMWSTPANIKTTATSIKKFYKCMYEHAKISKEEYTLLNNTIKDSMAIWQENCAIYNDPDEPNPFFMF